MAEARRFPNPVDRDQPQTLLQVLPFPRLSLNRPVMGDILATSRAMDSMEPKPAVSMAVLEPERTRLLDRATRLANMEATKVSGATSTETANTVAAGAATTDINWPLCGATRPW